LGSNGIPAAAVFGTPFGDGTTGNGATPKYKSTTPETLTFFGYVRIPASPCGTGLESWLCAAGKAEVFLDDGPFPFDPECVGKPKSNVYCDDGFWPDDVNTTVNGWRDSLCPLEIHLADALKDNAWHRLRITYTNAKTGGFAGHTDWCGHSSATYYGLTLFLGCEFEVRYSNVTPVRMSAPSKFMRTNLYGIPCSERSPTGEEESDQPENGFFVDTFNLAPTVSFPEFHIPIEGNEMAIELRRDGGVRTMQTSTNLSELSVTYPTDNLLGLGWNSNLSARAIIARANNCNHDPLLVSISDPGGTVYQYLMDGQQRFRPEVYDSQSNAAIRATPQLIGDTLTLKLRFGTKYVYTKVGRFYPPNHQETSEDYFRLDSAIDRNGNQIVYEYLTEGFPTPAGAMLVSGIHEQDHPERALFFTYRQYPNGGNQNGYDWEIRLETATDIQGNTITYDYTQYTFLDVELQPYLSQHQLLTKVTYPQVQDRDTDQMKGPTQHYDYEARVTEGPAINQMTPPFSRILHAGIKSTWQNGDSGTLTVFTYLPLETMLEFPVAIHPLKIVADGPPKYLMNVELQKVLTLSQVQTPDLSVTRFSASHRAVICDPSPCEEGTFTATTDITQPQGKILTYSWYGTARAITNPPDMLDPATGEILYWNQTGFGTVLNSFDRYTYDWEVGNESGLALVSYVYTDDLFGNLQAVGDMSNNRFVYDYETLESQISNQPTVKTVSMNIPMPPRSLVTKYEYETLNKIKKITDAGGKETRFEIDGNGNRTEIQNPSTSLGDRRTTLHYFPNGFLSSTADFQQRLTTSTREFYASPHSDTFYTDTMIVDPDGLNLKTVKEYDFLGNLIREIPPEGFVNNHNQDDYATTYEYDALRRRTKVSRPSVPYNGVLTPTVEEYFYDLRGNLVLKKAARAPGNQDIISTRFYYDSLNRPIRSDITASPTQTITTKKTYNKMGLVATETDANNHMVYLTYDALLRLRFRDELMRFNGQQETVEQEFQYATAGNELLNSGSGAFSYVSGWKPIRVINRRGSANALLPSQLPPNPPSEETATDSTYDEFYRLVQVVRRRDAGPYYPFFAGRPQEVVNGVLQPAEPQENTAYNSIGKIIKHTVALDDGLTSQDTYTFYDDFNRPTISVIDIDGDGNNNQAYDPSSLRVNNWSELTVDPGDLATMTRYDLSDKIIEVKDPEGNSTIDAYDQAGRLSIQESPAITNPATQITTRTRVMTAYDANGAVVETRGPYPYQSPPGGKLVHNYYDQQGRLEKTIVDLDGNGIPEDSADITTRIQYDLVGNQVKAIDARGIATTSTYDGANRKVTMVSDSGGINATIDFEYDPNSNQTAVIDPLGIRTETDYDEQNRVIYQVQAYLTPEQLDTEKAYDKNGNLVTLIVYNQVGSLFDPQLSTLEYDVFDRQVKENLPGSPPKITTYFSDGKLASTTDPKGQTVLFHYDRNRRLLSSTHKTAAGTTEETRSFLYDKVGNVRQVTEPSSITSYGYDLQYRLTSETKMASGQQSYSISSQYDLEGRRIKIIYPNAGRSLSQTFDPAGRLLTITDLSTLITTAYQYDKNGNVTRLRWPSSSDSSYTLQTLNTYDALNRLVIRVAHKRVGTSIVFSENCFYDKAGNITSANETINGQNRNAVYTYDSQHRLLQETWGSNVYVYTYDLIGNRLTMKTPSTGTNAFGYAYNPRNELQTIKFPSTGSPTSTTTYMYDPNGNCISKSLGSTTTTYTWDVSNRLKKAMSGASTLFQATYDYRTRRMTTTEGAMTTYFVYDGGLCIQERPSGGSSPSVEFVNGGGLGGGIGGLLYEIRGGARSHFVYNHVGHNVIQTDSNATVTGWNRYEAFGNRFASQSTSNKRLANTRELDSSTGLYSHGFRYYDPIIGRYISRDPLGVADGPNTYSYVHNNPVTGFDKVGLWDEAGMLQEFFKKYGDKGYALYKKMVADGFRFEKRNYWFDDWDVESENKVIGLASSWWGGITDSNEFAATQFYDALSHTYESFTATLMMGGAKLISPGTRYLQDSDDADLVMDGLSRENIREYRNLDSKFRRGLAELQDNAQNEAISAILGVGIAKKVGEALSNIKIYRASKEATKLLEAPQFAQHHIFPQKFGKFFKSKGIEIDNFTIELTESVHLKGVHGRGLAELPGRWNSRWEEFITKNPGASPKEIYQFGGKLMDEYGLSAHTISTYER
jgi:RHS repeat-associated protein